MSTLDPKRLTLLAEGSRTVLLGDEDRQIYPCTRPFYNDVYKGKVREPITHVIPPDNSPKFLGFKLTHTDKVPDGVVLTFQYFEAAGLRIYVAFEEGRRLWHLRELRSKPGSYFEELEA